ncbi:MAG: hypothetical protein K2P78_09790 [Gemmataceae bacterium]|nr:hypothetical protein [Gemmataceae bacterium]
MKEREPLVVGGLVALLLVLWLGFLVHASPRFAGSLLGGLLGVSGALLMLLSSLYLPVKRVPALKRWVTARVSMRTLLAWHMYTGLLGAILGVLHSGHKFESPLGIALTAMSLLVVLSGFVGRHLMKQVSLEVKEKKEMLTRLELAYREAAGEAAAHPEQAAVLRPLAGFWSRLVAGLFVPAVAAWGTLPAPVRALRLADAIADLEYAIKTHETFKRWFGIWLKVHIVTAFLLYALLGLHVWAGIHFGLRWFS